MIFFFMIIFYDQGRNEPWSYIFICGKTNLKLKSRLQGGKNPCAQKKRSNKKEKPVSPLWQVRYERLLCSTLRYEAAHHYGQPLPRPPRQIELLYIYILFKSIDCFFPRRVFKIQGTTEKKKHC